MKAELLSWCRRLELFSPGDRVICAVSGGADSMAMLWGLYSLRRELSVTVEAAHFNHRLRGAESDRDEALVRRFCEAHGIPLALGAAPPEAYGPAGVEETARRLRYAFFDTLSCDRLATAHTADDNAETVLENLLRGTGLRGLCGIPPVRGRIVRPMLFARHSALIDFLQDEGVPFAEDSTNAEDFCLRNRLRHGVLPLLCAESPSFPARLTERTLLLREEDEFLDRQALALLDAAAEGEETWRCEALRSAPEVLQRRAVRLLLRRYYPSDLAQRHVASVQNLLSAASPSAQVSLPQGRIARRVYGNLTLCAAACGTLPCTVLCVPGETVCGNVKIRCSIVDFFEKTENTRFQFAIKYGMIKNHTVVLRSRQTGDALRLPGGHSAAVKKLMIDRRVPRAVRDGLCVFAAGQEVLAVEGIGVSEICRPAAGEPALMIQIERGDVPW